MYLSSSCCRCTINHDRANNNGISNVEDQSDRNENQAEHEKLVVLRSYDNRVRKSLRNPEIYLNKVCQDEVGVGTTFRIVKLHAGNDDDIEALEAKIDESNPLESALW